MAGIICPYDVSVPVSRFNRSSVKDKTQQDEGQQTSKRAVRAY
jgi:hypothetical protein